MLHWHCVCDAGNGVAVSVNDIIIKVVATTLKVSTVHRLFIQHVNVLEQYTNHSTCMHAHMCICVHECERGFVCACVCRERLITVWSDGYYCV